MKATSFVLFLSFFLPLLSSCAAPTTNLPSTSYYDGKQIRQNHLKYEMNYKTKRDQRIHSLFYNLKKNTGEELCDRKLRPDLGINYGVYHRNGKSWFATAAQRQEEADLRDIMPYDREDTIYVRFVIPNSAADKAGVKAGDAIVSIFGKATPIGNSAMDDFRENIEENLTNSSLDMPIEIDVERGGKQMSITVIPDQTCPYELEIDTSFRGINAYADGEKVYLSEEIIDYLSDDNDLSGVMAHELAHNTLGHSRAKGINVATGAVVGAIFDVLMETDGAGIAIGATVGGQAYSQEFESEADYVSAYYMARSGYDYKHLGSLHKKLAARDKNSLYADGSTHPQPQNRDALLKETASEIELKKSFKEELLPDFKKVNSHLVDKRD